MSPLETKSFINKVFVMGTYLFCTCKINPKENQNKYSFLLLSINFNGLMLDLEYYFLNSQMD